MINARRRAAKEPEVARKKKTYHDDWHGRSPSPNGLRPWEKIWNAPFPPRFRLPTHMAKYAGDTNLRVWLEDYRLAYRVEGAKYKYFIIQYLPLYLAYFPRAWLEYLLHG